MRHYFTIPPSGEQEDGTAGRVLPAIGIVGDAEALLDTEQGPLRISLSSIGVLHT